MMVHSTMEIECAFLPREFTRVFAGSLARSQTVAIEVDDSAELSFLHGRLIGRNYCKLPLHQ